MPQSLQISQLLEIMLGLFGLFCIVLIVNFTRAVKPPKLSDYPLTVHIGSRDAIAETPHEHMEAIVYNKRYTLSGGRWLAIGNYAARLKHGRRGVQLQIVVPSLRGPYTLDLWIIGESNNEVKAAS